MSKEIVMKKVEFVIILIRTLSLFLIFKHIDLVLDFVSYSFYEMNHGGTFDIVALVGIFFPKLLYLVILFLLIYKAPSIAKRIVSDLQPDLDFIPFASLNLFVLGIILVAGYSFLDGLSETMVQMYYYFQNKLSGLDDNVIDFKPDLLLRSVVKTILGFLAIYYHKLILIYLENVDKPRI